MKKFLPWIWKGLAALGLLVVVAMIVTARKKSTATGTSFTANLKDEAATRTGGLFTFITMLATACGLLWSAGHPDVDPMIQQAVIWGSVAASVAGTFNITYIPQFISFTIASAPTSFQINVQGDGVIFNLDANGVTGMSNIRAVGVIGNTYMFQLADGLINGKNGTVTITNSAAATLNVNCWSKDVGSMYMVYATQNALTQSGIQLNKFAYAAFPSAAAADSFTLEYNSGITQVATRDDLNANLQWTQNQVTSRYNIDNIAPAMMKKVTFIPVAAQNVYVMNYQAATGVVNAAVLAKA